MHLTRTNDDKSYIADAYYSMAQFWSEMQKHTDGLAEGSIWDTFESGERVILERKLAKLYGAPDAVVICSGMGAIAVTLIAISAHLQLPIQRNSLYGYFENVDLMENVLDKCKLLGKSGEPGIKLIEPISNEPRLTINLRGFNNEVNGYSVIDNSLFSISASWSFWRDRINGSFCLVESLPKYLSHTVSGGVVFGEEEMIGVIRNTARRLGMLLTRSSCKALLKDDSIDTTADRLQLLGERAQYFADTLRAERPELIVRLPQEIAQGAGLDGVRSSLVFVLYPEDINCLEEFENWSLQASKLLDGRPMVRAGYGWNRTYGRSYGKNILNTVAGTNYLRFSIGLEDLDTIKQLAKLLRRVD
ncbi:hypothetical protein [Brevibacillus gelatini]